MDVLSCDVLVVGGGGAGLRAAIAASETHPKLRVAVISKKVKCGEIAEEAWGIKTSIMLPSGGEIGLYQPKHPTALDLGS